MKVEYILDTSTVSLFTKGNSAVVERVMELPPEKTAITAITIAEVYYGLVKHGNKLSEETKADIRMALEQFTCLDIEAIVAYRYAMLKASAGAEGCKSDSDLWMVAFCDYHNATLITTDAKLSHLQKFTGAIEIIVP